MIYTCNVLSMDWYYYPGILMIQVRSAPATLGQGTEFRIVTALLIEESPSMAAKAPYMALSGRTAHEHYNQCLGIVQPMQTCIS